MAHPTECQVVKLRTIARAEPKDMPDLTAVVVNFFSLVRLSLHIVQII